MNEKAAHQPRLDQTVFYALEKAIKSYRQFAQRNIKNHDLDITIDQWLVLKTIHDEPTLSQKAIAERVFKDYASITRMIELLVQRDYLKRSFHQADRRRFQLRLTPLGKRIYQKLIPIVNQNRQQALSGINDVQISQLHQLLRSITKNCVA